MWLNGYFTSSAVVDVCCQRPCHPLLSSSSTAIVRQYVNIYISAFHPLHPQISSAKFIRNLPLQHLHFTIAALVVDQYRRQHESRAEMPGLCTVYLQVFDRFR